MKNLLRRDSSLPRFAVTMLILTACRVSAATFDPADSACLFGPDENLTSMIDTLTYTSEVLPKVPPEEEKFFVAADLEVTEARAARSDDYLRLLSRYVDLQDRPAFRLWHLRQLLLRALSALRNVNQGSKSFYTQDKEAARLELAADAIAPVAHYEQALAVETRRDVRSLRIPEESTAKVLSGMHISDDLAYYIGCRLARVMGPQKSQ